MQKTSILKKISLKNFQSHPDNEIILDEGINVLTGESDHGKSSFIRAIRWVVENRPAGDGFRSKFAEKEPTVVRLTFDDGWVERRKSKSVNSYLLCTEEAGEQEFKAMGSSVPEEVLAFLRLRPVNFQYQMDAPFLLSSGSSEVARYLNKEARLDVIDRSNSAIRKKILQNSSDIKQNQSSIESLEKDLEQYQDLDQVEEAVKRGEELSSNLSEMRASYKELSRLENSLTEAQQIVAQEGVIISRYAPLFKKATPILEKIKKDQTPALKALFKKFQESSREVQKYQKVLSLDSQFQQAEEAEEKLRSISQQIKSLSSLLSTLQNNIRQISQLQDNEEKARKEYEEACKDTVCPTCGQSWKRGRHKHTKSR